MSVSVLTQHPPVRTYDGYRTRGCGILNRIEEEEVHRIKSRTRARVRLDIHGRGPSAGLTSTDRLALLKDDLLQMNLVLLHGLCSIRLLQAPIHNAPQAELQLV